MAAPSLYELKILPEFRRRVKDLSLNEFLNSDMQLLRWIRARENNLDQAELMLRAHMKWREEVSFDQLLLLDMPKQCEGVILDTILGFDNDNFPVVLSPLGKWDVKRLLQEIGPDALLRSKWKLEKEIQEAMKNKLTTEGVPVTQYSIICDLDGLSISQGTFAVLRFLTDASRIDEANFPESLKSWVVINAPWFFPIFFKCTKPFVSEITKSKIHVYGGNRKEWMQFLGSVFPHHVLPIKYGGSNSIEIP